MAFRFLPHTADVKFEASASSLGKAFSEAARALTRVMTDAEVRARRSVPVLLEAESVEAVFFEYLAFLIVCLDTEGLFVSRAEVRVDVVDGVWRVSGVLWGDDARSYERHGDVKAPTYHDLGVVERSDGSWVLRATLDI